jgi:hypothetical protein
MERTMDVSAQLQRSPKTRDASSISRDVTGDLLYRRRGRGEDAGHARVVGTFSKTVPQGAKKVKERNLKAEVPHEEYDAEHRTTARFELDRGLYHRVGPSRTNGQPFPITRGQLDRAPREAAQWRRQVDQAMNDHARFFSTSSARLMEYAAHDARMRQPADKEGKVSTRRALEATAARGVVERIKLLDGSTLPRIARLPLGLVPRAGPGTDAQA